MEQTKHPVLRRHQTVALKKMSTGKDGARLIILRYGAGKTAIALTHLFSTLSHPAHIVVLCRAYNILTWQREIAKWCAPEVLVETYTGHARRRYNTLNVLAQEERASILLMPYSTLRVDGDLLYTLLMSHPTGEHLMDAIIADETTIVANPKSDTSKAARLLARASAAPVIGLTGNSMPEGPQQIWAQMDLVYGNANPFGTSYYSFLRRWFLRTDYAWALKLDMRNKFLDIIEAHSVWLSPDEQVKVDRITKRPQERYTIECFQETAEQRRLLDILFGEWRIQDHLGNTDYNYTMQVLQKAQQIASGFYYKDTDTGQKRAIYLASNPKFSLLTDLLKQLFGEDPDTKIIIWYKYQAELPLIQDACEEHNLVVGPDVKALNFFMYEPSVHLIAMPVDCCEGFNELSSAAIDIHVSNDFSQNKRNQAEARNARSGCPHRIVTHIDIGCPTMRDFEVITALQTKSLTPERLQTIVYQERSRFIVDTKKGVAHAISSKGHKKGPHTESWQERFAANGTRTTDTEP